MNNFDKLKFVDCQFIGYSWNKIQSEIHIEISDNINNIDSIICRWIKVFNFTQNAPGPLLSYEGKIEKTKDNDYNVFISFANDGELMLTCNEIEIKNLTIAST
jgi:hypothetical protein